MADEEESVVLKGSELYNYLSGQFPREFDFYVKSEMDYEEQALSERVNDSDSLKPPETKVPVCYLDYLDSILNSSVLLDDDVSFLYSYTVDLVSSPQSSRFFINILEGVLTLSSRAVFPLVSSSLDSVVIDELISASKGFYTDKRRHIKIEKVLNILKKIHFYVKKIVQTIREGSALQKQLELKRRSSGEAEDLPGVSDKKRHELELLKEVIAQNIIKHIELTKNFTLFMYNTMPLHYVDAEDQYLAYCSDRQLGIEKFRHSPNKIISSSQPLPSIEVLKDIYILMQSEMLRRLGLCFCPTLWSTDDDNYKLYQVFDGLDQYYKSCCSILLNLKFYYKRHILPPAAERKKVKDYSMIEGYQLIHKLSISLSNLVKESQELELFIENAETVDDNEAKLMLQRLEKIKVGLNECHVSLNACEKFVGHKCNREVKKDDLPGISKEMKETEDSSISLQVGKTDLSISGEDRVFFAVTEGNEEELKTKEVDIDDGAVQMPPFVMSELRLALLSKKTEFEKREESAVADDPNYKSFAATEVPIPLPRSLPVPIPNARQLPETPLGLDLQKSIAAKAANLSSQFLVHKEEHFGSSDDESE